MKKLAILFMVALATTAGAIDIASAEFLTSSEEKILTSAVTNSLGVIDGDTIYARSLYVELHIHDSSAVTNDIPTGTTYTRIPWTNMGLTNGIIVSTATSNMTLVVNGRYQVTGTFCFGGEVTGTPVVWRGVVFQDDVEQDNIHFMRTISVQASQGAAPFSGFLNVTNQPSVIDFRIRHGNVANREIYMTYCNFGVVYIGE